VVSTLDPGERVRQERRQILESAKAVLQTPAITARRSTRIIERAQIARGTFYLY
jgi:AcrR family transcriptional regulator